MACPCEGPDRLDQREQVEFSDPQWPNSRSLKKLQVYLNEAGLDSAKPIQFLKDLWSLRHGAVHRKGDEYRKAAEAFGDAKQGLIAVFTGVQPIVHFRHSRQRDPWRQRSRAIAPWARWQAHPGGHGRRKEVLNESRAPAFLPRGLRSRSRSLRGPELRVRYRVRHILARTSALVFSMRRGAPPTRPPARAN
jgi:hypothetical protein